MERDINVDALALRPIQRQDAERVHQWASQPIASQYQAWGPNNRAETDAFVDGALAEWNVTPQTRWTFAAAAGTVTAADEVVGIGEVHRHSAVIAEISYAVHTDLWGTWHRHPYRTTAHRLDPHESAGLNRYCHVRPPEYRVGASTSPTRHDVPPYRSPQRPAT